ncbi:facilitated trehalose transporter Tret1 isoform X1 [Lepeophtheirus salmonis]|uniref:facilitated trehalose transporter Tret1 isoform X1 n=2 Tax=Lepeophtheirus salmonis TaxID=72036 RepID=UPI001AE32420|nr:facilitated trehalose transporter Tret1-like [Lepeophtheirus salmonis]
MLFRKKVFEVNPTDQGIFHKDVHKKFIKQFKTVVKLKYLHQTTVTIVASLGYFIGGLARAWSAPGIPSLQGLDSNETVYALAQAPLSNELTSWITSLTPMGAMCGGIMSSFALLYFGRLKTLQISAFLYAIGFGLLGSSFYTSYVEAIMVSRILKGFSLGLCIPAAQIYVTECVDSNVRGTFGSFPAIAMALGIAICYIVGMYLPWHFLSFFCTGVSVFFGVFLIFIPETPQWLLSKRKENEARRSLEWLRGTSDVSSEFEDLNQKHSPDQAKSNKEGDAKRQQIWDKAMLEPFFISLMLMGFQQWSGVNACIFNIVSIFKSAESNISSDLSTVMFGMVGFVATLGSAFLVDGAGRRPLLMISGILMGLTMGLLGLFFHLQSIGSSDGYDWIPISSLVVFMIGYSLGFASIPYVLMGEILPTQFKNLFSGIAAFYNLGNTFLVIKLFSNISSSYGLQGVFWIYSGCSFTSVVFVFFCLPETKGKSVSEIEDIFHSKWASKDSKKIEDDFITKL